MAAVLAVVMSVGCDDDDGGKDSGFGAGQSVPATVNCGDLCKRMGDCFVALCNEDTMSSNYDGLDGLLQRQCESTCTEETLRSRISADAWRCVFQSSCRAVFGKDECRAMSRYTCR